MVDVDQFIELIEPALRGLFHNQLQFCNFNRFFDEISVWKWSFSVQVWSHKIQSWQKKPKRSLYVDLRVDQRSLSLDQTLIHVDRTSSEFLSSLGWK